MKRRRTRTGALLLLAALLLVSAALAWFVWLTGRPYPGLQRPAFVVIERRTPTREIAARLRDAGVIRSSGTFLVLRYLLPGRSLKAGEYYFDHPLSVRAVIEKLRRGEVYYYTLTIPEGHNLFDVAALMAGTGLVTHEEAWRALQDPALVTDLDPTARTLEGYVFPDTYRFTRPASARAMTNAMVSRFRAVYGELAGPYSPARPVHEVVTMASLVEKETGVTAERPLVASVFYNRLQTGMRLQCDPTVIYAALLDGHYRGAIYQSDLESDSPYNTYTHTGLPPGPIANPGRAALEAAMAPASTKYMYFVANGDNGHHFSATLEEHFRNVTAYRRNQK